MTSPPSQASISGSIEERNIRSEVSNFQKKPHPCLSYLILSYHLILSFRGPVPFAWFDREGRVMEQELPIGELLLTAVPGAAQLGAGEVAFCSSTLWVARTQLKFKRRRRCHIRSSLRAAAARQMRRAQKADPDSLDDLLCWYFYIYILYIFLYIFYIYS